MSALAARRAAAAASAASSAASSPGPSRPAAGERLTKKAKKATGSSKVSTATSTPAQHADSDQELQIQMRGIVNESEDGSDRSGPGPLKRARIDSGPRQRYTALEPTLSSVPAAGGGLDRKGKGKAAQVKKRAFSPSAPMESSDDEEEGGSDGMDERDSDEESDASAVDEPEVAGDVDDDFTPFGSHGPWRPRPSENTVALSRFVPRRGHNLELVSSAALSKAGLAGQGDGLVLSISAEEDLYLAGTFTLTPLSGQISFSGTTLCTSSSDRSYTVLSPISHAVPCISFASASSGETSPSLGRLRLPSTFTVAHRAVVLVRGTVTGIEGMRGGAIPGFATAWGDEKGWMGVKGVHSIPGSIIAPCYPYQQPDSWTAALDALANDAAVYVDATAPVVLVKGPKRSGKSTIARTALNGLLQLHERVAWLECDLGQGEFGCGGVIGLWVLDAPVYGPAFTHPRIPYRAHFLGTYTPLTCPDEYIAAIEHLLHVYRYELDSSTSKTHRTSSARGTAQTGNRRKDATPLIVNTQGWVKGLGEELLYSIEGMVQATHVFAFDRPAESDEGDRNGWTSSPTLGVSDLPPSYLGDEAQVYSLEQAPVTPLQQRYTAADHRNLSTLAYLQATFSTSDTATPENITTWDFTSPLIATPPLEVHVSPDGPIRSVYMQGEGAEGISARDLGLALNGAVVALIDDQSDASTLAAPHTYVQGRSVPSLETVNFLGLAVVRAAMPLNAVDEAHGHEHEQATSYKLHLITPLPAETLCKANAIIRNGAMELPTPAMLDWRSTSGGMGDEGLVGVPWADVPFFGAETGGVGIEKRRVRRNLMRKGM